MRKWEPGNRLGRRPWRRIGAALLLLALAVPARAQLGLPTGPLGDTLGGIGANLRGTLSDLGNGTRDTVRSVVEKLEDARATRLKRFVETTPGVELDDADNPARAGEVLLLDPDPRALEIARTKGFALIEKGALDGLDIGYARLSVPAGTKLGEALAQLRKALPDHDVSADQIHFRAGVTPGLAGAVSAAPAALPRGGRVGVIDGGMTASNRLAAQEGFAKGAPRPDEHAMAIGSLLAGAGTARIYSADVYGSDPAGGDALAIARALAWMQAKGVPVVSISLVGPQNPLLARAVRGAQAKGMQVVAAVGNDGAASPPSYPASYAGVIAVTGVDARGRVLIEAGRAAHLDYAAPGADLSARVPGKGRIDLRGTSFAAPLVASRLAARRAGGLDAAAALHALDAEAVTGGKGTARGILCNICRSGL
ncbi:S8 family serine peptidase [Novosphingobium profundi]|uniref:S8 family serine peptidase n=1 Tax=Novosphingobium profundi TaxID=1774954 RepID=UPI001BD9336A|nr:S8 family serine peptidase [Novosphingobium profundi]MBT0669500.1 S8 family serine peptidase [Novosphingobium profundi]